MHLVSYMLSFSMRDHPIPPVTELLQYRAIGIVRAKYIPGDPDHFTRGVLVDQDGLELEAVVLGRVLSLMKRHLDADQYHLWVVYPRCREPNHLHLQIAGIWEPSTLSMGTSDLMDEADIEPPSFLNNDELPEGDDYFSIRGELIYTKPETEEIVVKIRQRARSNRKRNLPFKLNLKGSISLEHLRHFISLDVRRTGNQLCLENYEILERITTRGGTKKGSKNSLIRKVSKKVKS